MPAVDTVSHVRVSRNCCGSWACPHCAARLGRVLGARLRERLSGRRVLFLTLTFDPSKFESRFAAYEFVKRNHSVARAMARFGRVYGVEVRGAWFAKMELQENGWPHFHVVVEVHPDMPVLERDAFAEFWSYGFSKCQEAVNISYLAKYASKGAGHIGLELSGLPARGVRWTFASRGFWETPTGPVVEGAMAEIADSDDPISEPEEVSEGETAFEDVFDLAEDDAGALHVLRVSACGQSATVLRTECVNGQEVVKASVRVPLEAGFVAQALEYHSGVVSDDGIYAVTPVEWQAVCLELGRLLEVPDDVCLFVR